MSLYLDLLPPPQFDRSLVSYVVGNFQRVKDILIRASGRTFVYNMASAGPWPKSFTVNHPFRSDTLAIYAATCWATSVGMFGTALYLDGSAVGTWGTYFANESSSHKQTTGQHIARSLAVGNHTWQIGGPIGNTTSDANDQGYIVLIMTEV